VFLSASNKKKVEINEEQKHNNNKNGRMGSEMQKSFHDYNT
jgi:hypothetical protein